MSETANGSVVITHDVGLHARPSVKLTKLAKGYASTLEIAGTADGPWIDAKSIVKVMAMKAKAMTCQTWMQKKLLTQQCLQKLMS